MVYQKTPTYQLCFEGIGGKNGKRGFENGIKKGNQKGNLQKICGFEKSILAEKGKFNYDIAAPRDAI